VNAGFEMAPMKACIKGLGENDILSNDINNYSIKKDAPKRN